MKVDPNSVEYMDIPLWVVYGADCFPSLLLCEITIPTGQKPTIWGYSVYRNKGGFRTLGIQLSDWIERETNPRFFDNQAEAIELLKKITTPRKSP